MGCALAAEARFRGARVVLVTGPSSERVPSGVRAIRVTSALEMMNACLGELAGADVIIKAAAVGDYSPKAYSPNKIKRGTSPLTLELEQNPDIALEISKRKSPSQILVGFAAETENVEENAIKKLSAKGLDLVVANDVSESDAGFAVDTNRARVYFAPRWQKEPSPVLFGTKQDVASGVLDIVAGILR
jgi:phosphopantothenoylcysteine decarboxylase/phosphopantothenate--cysteine ligase